MLLILAFKIAVDVDGVLLNTQKTFLEKYNEKYKTNYTTDYLNTYDWHQKLGLNWKEFIKMLTNACKRIDKIEPCFELAPYYLFLLNNKYKVDIVTYSVADKDRLIRRLEILHIRKGLEYNKLCQFKPNNELTKLTLKYDIYIDDSPKLAEEIQFHGGNMFCLLFDQPWNRHVNSNSNIIRVRDWEEVDEAIKLLEKRCDRCSVECDDSSTV